MKDLLTKALWRFRSKSFVTMNLSIFAANCLLLLVTLTSSVTKVTGKDDVKNKKPLEASKEEKANAKLPPCAACGNLVASFEQVCCAVTFWTNFTSVGLSSVNSLRDKCLLNASNQASYCEGRSNFRKIGGRSLFTMKCAHTKKRCYVDVSNDSFKYIR